MDVSPADQEVLDNRAAGQFEINLGDRVAFLTYKLQGSMVAYLHTEVPKALEGRGIAGRLAKHALDSARANQLDVVPICPYVADYIKRHPEFEELVAPRVRWREFLNAR